MSLLDLTQDATDQGALHVTVAPIADVSTPLYEAVCKKLTSMAPIQLSDPKGVVLYLKFIKSSELPVWAEKEAKWSEFCAHKHMVGLLAVAQCTDIDEALNITVGFKTATSRFKTLSDFKCLIYGPKKVTSNSFDSKKGFCLIDCKLEGDIYEAVDETEVNTQQLEEIVHDFAQAIYNSIKSRIEHVKNYISPNSGRVEAIRQLKSPFEATESTSSSSAHRQEHEDVLEQRQLSRTNLLVRWEKHLADLLLLSGQLQEATERYRYSAEQLKSCKDWLWAGAAYEGLGSTVLVMKRCEEVLGLKAQGRTSASSNPFNKFRTRTKLPPSSRVTVTSDLRRKMSGTSSSSSLANGTKVTRSNSARQPLAIKSPSPEPVNNHEDLDGPFRAEEYPRQDSLSNYIDSEEDDDAALEMSIDQPDSGVAMTTTEEEEEGEERELLIDARLLQKDFVLDKYTQAIDTYKRAGAIAWVPHMEALLKFSKYLGSQKRLELANKTLQRMLKIGNEPSLKMSDMLSLYVAMAGVYRSMGFHRKAAMFTHSAARCAATMAVCAADSLKAYSLLKQCLPSYKLPVDLKNLPESAGVCVGWPGIQAAVLSDFVNLSRKLNEDLVAVKYACYLLQMLHLHLSPEQMHDLAAMMEEIAQEAREYCRANPSYTASVNQQLFSPLPLTEFPLVTLFEPKPLVAQLAPIKDPHFQPPSASSLSSGAETSGSPGPFIYSALQGRRKKRRREVFWVQGDPAEISMDIANPFPEELRVEKMSAVLEGASVEVYPSSLTLPADSTPQQFVLLCIPQEAGTLTVQGYDATVFGVYNKCSMRIHDNPLIHVVPPLPQLRVKATPSPAHNTPSPAHKEPLLFLATKEADRRGSVISGGGSGGGGGGSRVELLDGESCQCEFRLECLQDIPVERVSFKLAEGNDDFCLFSWDSECLQTLVPLSKEQVGAFLMTISARIPSWFRVLNDQLTTGVSKPAYFHHHGNISASTISSGGGRASFQSFESPPALGGGSSSPHSSTSYDSTSSSPTLSPVAKRPRNQTNLHVASSASSEGSEQRNALVESLDLDHPAFSGKSKRHSNSATLPHSGCSSPVETQKRASTLQRTPKINRKNVVGARDNLGEFDYDKVFFPDDKRASIRSDPGDRTRPPLSGTRHSTSARSRKQKVATGLDVTNSKPMSVPRNEARLASQYGGSPILETAVGASSSSSGKPSTFSVESEIHRPQGKFITPLTRSTATRNQSTSARKPSSSISKGLISTPFGPLFKEVPRAPSETKVVGRFSIEYSGGAGGREGYCRSTETSVTVFVRPALVFERFEISGIEGSPEMFELKFTVHNVSDRKLEVTVKVNQVGLVESGGKPERTLTLDPSAGLQVRLAIRRFVLPPDTELQNEMKLYCARLVEMVRVQWREGEGELRTGEVSLDGLRLPLSNLSLMKPLPLQFKLSVNGVTHSSSYTAHFSDLKVGAPINARLHVTNSSGHVMPPSFLVLEPYQFSQEQKRIMKDLRGKLLHSGGLLTRLPLLAPGQSHEHSLSLTFLRKGTFQLDVKCLPVQGRTTDTTGVTSSTSSPSNCVTTSTNTVPNGATTSTSVLPNDDTTSTSSVSNGVTTSTPLSDVAPETDAQTAKDSPSYLRKWQATKDNNSLLRMKPSMTPQEDSPPSPSPSSLHTPTSPEEEGEGEGGRLPISPDHRPIMRGRGSVKNRIAAIEKLNKSPDLIQRSAGTTTPGSQSPSQSSRRPEPTLEEEEEEEEEEKGGDDLKESSEEVAKPESLSDTAQDPVADTAASTSATQPLASQTHTFARLRGSPHSFSHAPRTTITPVTPSHLHPPPGTTGDKAVYGSTPQKVCLQNEGAKELRTDTLSARVQLLTKLKVQQPFSGPYITFNVV